MAGQARYVSAPSIPSHAAPIHAAVIAPWSVRKYAPHTIHERQFGRIRM